METKKVDLSLLKMDERLATLFPIKPEDLEAMKESLQENDQIEPIKVNKYDGRLISGYTRVLAAKELGWPYLYGIYIDIDFDQEVATFIIENVVRRHMSVADWVELYCRLEPSIPDYYFETGPGRPDKGASDPITKVAELTATKRKTVRKRLERYFGPKTKADGAEAAPKAPDIDGELFTEYPHGQIMLQELLDQEAAFEDYEVESDAGEPLGCSVGTEVPAQSLDTNNPPSRAAQLAAELTEDTLPNTRSVRTQIREMTEPLRRFINKHHDASDRSLLRNELEELVELLK